MMRLASTATKNGVPGLSIQVFQEDAQHVKLMGVTSIGTMGMVPMEGKYEAILLPFAKIVALFCYVPTRATTSGALQRVRPRSIISQLVSTIFAGRIVTGLAIYAPAVQVQPPPSSIAVVMGSAEPDAPNLLATVLIVRAKQGGLA